MEVNRNCLFCNLGMGVIESTHPQEYSVCRDCLITLEDFYAILGVPFTASPEEIKKAYRGKAMDFHPDRQTGATDAVKEMAARVFSDANQANMIFTDPVKKAAYDRSYRAKRASSGTGRGTSRPTSRSSKSSPSGSSTGSTRTSGSSPPPPPPPPPPKTYNPVIAVDQYAISKTATEGEMVEFGFTVKHVSGELPPKWKMTVLRNGDFLDASNTRINPPDSFPMRVTVILPFAEVGEYEGSLEIQLEDILT